MSSDLLDMKAAAAYLHLNYFTFREYVIQGLIPTVRYPSLGHHNEGRPQSNKGKPRRTRLFLKADLDAFVLRFREDSTDETGAKVGTQNGAPTPKKYQKGWQDEVRLRLAK